MSKPLGSPPPDPSSPPLPDERPQVTLRRSVSTADHLRPQRWAWDLVVAPIDRRLRRQSPTALRRVHVRRLRYFLIDGVFATISENFYGPFVVLFLLAFGATSGQVGLLTAVANLLGTLSLIPGAHLAERTGRRKAIVLWTGGGFARLAILAITLVPLVSPPAGVAIALVIAFNGVRSFMNNFCNPAWTSIVADIVPPAMRGRYLANRNIAMGLSSLLIGPFAGWLIPTVNGWGDNPVFGYQMVFALAALSGVVATFAYGRLPEPPFRRTGDPKAKQPSIAVILRSTPGFLGFVVSSLVWQLALQTSAPFFTVYMVKGLGATTQIVGFATGVSALTALVGQRLFGRLLDTKGSLWVQLVSGFAIPFIPFVWTIISRPEQAYIANGLAGFLWAGYGLSNFNLLLDLAPPAYRPRAIAIYQTVAFSAAVVGPLIGGFVAETVGYRWIFGISAIGRLAGIVLFAATTGRVLYRQAVARRLATAAGNQSVDALQ